MQIKSDILHVKPENQKRNAFWLFHVVPGWLVRISKSILIQLNGGTAFHQAVLRTTLRALFWSSLCMNVKQNWLVGNKCEDENWRHCCFPWGSLLELVKLACSFHLFAMSLSVKHVRKLRYICIYACIGSASQISNFSLFKAIFTICIFSNWTIVLHERKKWK